MVGTSHRRRPQGLIWSLFVVNITATALLAVATGALSVQLPGAPWVAALVGVFPGVWWSFRVTVADTLADGARRGHPRPARQPPHTVGGARRGCRCAGQGNGCARAGRLGAAPVAGRVRWYPALAAGCVAALWAAYLRIELPGAESVAEFTWPLIGLWDAITDRWLLGYELRGLLTVWSPVSA